MDEKTQAAAELLLNSRSTKRRTGAKRLRKIADPEAGEALFSALKEEVRDKRTWETQYQMVMALGACNYRRAVPFLETLLNSSLEPAVKSAIGHALLRLSMKDARDVDVCFRFIEGGHRYACKGAFEAVAILRIVPVAADVERLVQFGLELDVATQTWELIWLLRAAPGWPEELVRPLLDRWGSVEFSEQQQVHGAVELLRKKKYFKWSTL